MGLAAAPRGALLGMTVAFQRGDRLVHVLIAIFCSLTLIEESLRSERLRSVIRRMRRPPWLSGAG